MPPDWGSGGRRFKSSRPDLRMPLTVLVSGVFLLTTSVLTCVRVWPWSVWWADGVLSPVDLYMHELSRVGTSTGTSELPIPCGDESTRP